MRGAKDNAAGRALGAGLHLPAMGSGAPVRHISPSGPPHFPPAFQWLFAADMVSLFGSLISRTALPFVAILFLNARPYEVALLGVADIVAGFASALLLGAWVDRWPKRRVMVVADLSRAVLLLTVPVSASVGWLSVPLLLFVALACGVFNVAFELAYSAWLPRLVPQGQLLAANSRIAAGQAVVETASFGVGGWLVQWLSAPVAVFVDALSYLGSALLIGRARVAPQASVTPIEPGNPHDPHNPDRLNDSHATPPPEPAA